MSLTHDIQALQQRLNVYLRTDINYTLAEDDDMIDRHRPPGFGHYFRVGRGAIEILAQALLLSGITRPSRVLDLPCGFGRVLRHLRAFFPEAEITASDLYPDRIEFCTKILGARGALSDTDFRKVKFKSPFDVIWCGSLLTHLAEDDFREALALMIRSLADPGVAVITLHGRHSTYRQKHVHPYISKEKFSEIEESFAKTGFGYADYAASPSSWGVSVTAPSYVCGILERMPEVRILGYWERAWDDHQDVLIFGKPPGSPVVAPDVGGNNP